MYAVPAASPVSFRLVAVRPVLIWAPFRDTVYVIEPPHAGPVTAGQLRSISLEEIAVAVREVGAGGALQKVVALADAGEDAPAEFRDTTV